jgi:hypothetical protein
VVLGSPDKDILSVPLATEVEWGFIGEDQSSSIFNCISSQKSRLFSHFDGFVIILLQFDSPLQ